MSLAPPSDNRLVILVSRLLHAKSFWKMAIHGLMISKLA